MRILVCSNAYPPQFVGGAELVAHEQVKALARLGHEVIVFAADSNAAGARHSRTNDTYEGIKVLRIKTIPEDYSPEFLNFFHPQIDAHFRDTLNTFGPDIVHCHNLIGLSVKIPMLARQAGARTVCTLHDLWGYCLKNTEIRWDGAQCQDISLCELCLPRLHDGRKQDIPIRFRKDFIEIALNHVDQFVAPSQHIAQSYIAAGFAENQISVIPNGIDVSRFSHLRPLAQHCPFRIGFVGHFGKHKGVETLLSALALLPTEHRPSLTLAGQGPQESSYINLIEELSLTNHVRFLGQVSNAKIGDVYANCDVIVLPSIWNENQPVCLMEAMASGLPVVASNKGGIPELIEHGHNGLLFETGDPTDLATKLNMLMVSPSLQRTMGKNGRARVQDMTYDRQACLHQALYLSMIRQPENINPAKNTIVVFGQFSQTRSNNYLKSLLSPEYDGKYFIPWKWSSGLRKDYKGIFLIGPALISIFGRNLKIKGTIPFLNLLRLFFRKIFS